MTRQRLPTITYDDELHPGKPAEVLAWDVVFTTGSHTTSLLLLEADGRFAVHRHSCPSGWDGTVIVSHAAAEVIYRRMRRHTAPYERLQLGHD